MMKFAAAAFTIAAIMTPALADSMSTAVALGSVLASEQACGLTYDQAAISAYVDAHVKADDMDFPATLQTMTGGQEFQIKEMSKSQLTAHCTQIKRLAESYGFVSKQ